MSDLDLDRLQALCDQHRWRLNERTEYTHEHTAADRREFAAAVPALIARVRELEAQRRAVLDLHHAELPSDEPAPVRCHQCGFGWPCSTVRVLDGT